MTSSSTIRKMINPSIVLYGAKNAELEDKPVPELHDPHDVLVRIAYIGVCGSDASSPPLNPLPSIPNFQIGPLLAPWRHR